MWVFRPETRFERPVSGQVIPDMPRDFITIH
jgi:hypothetical protein